MMRELKEFLGDGGSERLLLALGLTKGQEEDYVEARALLAALPDAVINHTLTAAGVEPGAGDPSIGDLERREAWLAIQAAAFREASVVSH
jgi:hypothetical protein